MKNKFSSKIQPKYNTLGVINIINNKPIKLYYNTNSKI